MVRLITKFKFRFENQENENRRKKCYMKNRSEVEIMASLLRSASKKWEYKTTIMNTAALSHSQLVRYLDIAVQKGLVEYSEISGLYKTTEEGMRYLDKYMQLLRLLPAIPDLPDIIVDESREQPNTENGEPERDKNPVKIASNAIR